MPFEQYLGGTKRARERAQLQLSLPRPKSALFAKEAAMPAKNRLPSRFILNGFTHDKGFRQFAFEGIEEDRDRTQFTVRADLTLARAYGIHIQDLPLLCREFLERRAVTEDARRSGWAPLKILETLAGRRP